MELKNTFLAGITAATVLVTGAFAQETSNTVCKVGEIINYGPYEKNGKYCFLGENDSRKVLTLDGKVIADTPHGKVIDSDYYIKDYTIIYSTDLQVYIIRKSDNTVIKIKLPEGSTIENIFGEEILIEDSSNKFSVINFEGKEIISSENIIILTSKGYEIFDVDKSSEEAFDLFVSKIAGILEFRDNDLYDKPTYYSVFNTESNDDLVRFIWLNRESFAKRIKNHPRFGEIYEMVKFANEHFGEIEETVGKLEGKRILENREKGYDNGDYIPYLEAFGKIPGLLEIFGYEKNAPHNDDVFGSLEIEGDKKYDIEKEQVRIVRRIQSVYRRLNDPMTKLMIDWFISKTK